MRFKSIVLQGFKSFVEKTAVTFPGGITCVVGPNGSGKSNIMDAVRWVFGEQSPKELRGSDMEDVIFGGSVKRKPSGFAEVELTVSDLPESVTAKWGTLSEITVSRKFYRTGEREYKINNRKCRLKDIREIFYDTGMGPRSISIIEQGKVEKIIQATPEELRLFLEETAGVVRFKERKKEAERRLHQTKDNLGRVNDIISEIRTQLDILCRQLETVKKFRELSGRKTELDKNIILYKYIKLKNDSASLTEEINKEKKGMSGTLAEFEKLVTAETEKEKDLNRLRGSFRETNEKMLFLGDSIAAASGDIKLLENEIAGAEKTRERLHFEIEDLEKKFRELTENRVNILQNKEQAERSRATLNETIEELEDKIAELNRMREDLKYDINGLDDDYLELTQKLTNINNSVFEKETLTARLEADKKRFTLEKGDLENEIEKAVRRAEETQLEYTEMKAAVKELAAELKSLRESLEEAKTMEDDAREERDSLKLRKTSLESRISVLTEQIENAAVGDSGEYLKRFESSLLIDKLEDPREAPLHMADIVVFRAEDKSGVLATVKEMTGSLRFTFADEAEALFGELSGRVKIADNIIKLGSLYRKIGDDDKGVLILKLKNELKTASETLGETTAGFEEADIRFEGLHERMLELSELIAEKENRKSTLETETKNTARILDEAVTVKEKLSRRGEVLEKEMEFTLAEMQRIELALVKLREEREEAAEAQKEKEDEKSALEERLEDLNNLYEEAKDGLSSIRIEERGFSEQISALTRELQSTDREISETTRKTSDTKSRLSKLLTVDIINFKERLETKKIEYASLMKQQNELRSSAVSTDREVAELEKELENLKKEIERVNRDIEKLRSTVTDSEIKRERVITEMESLDDQFTEKFEEDISKHDPDFTDFQPNKAKSELDAISKLIDGLGPLNMAAETEYEEVEKRNEFLTQQRKDLEDAVGSIHELISEIDDSTSALFRDTFEGVKANFKRVFDILFGDGRAELRLSEPDNLLTSGVEIFVQPPGKNLQNMNLLSGGEKAMSACTLLFALFLYKPTPFCFLDEIDAPLDEANIDKFMRVVKTLSADTQFVIITHSQKTMAEADSLYGVTMQEPGVSKLLSVSMSDLRL
jgi:chromosome segregation protein